MPDLLAQLPDSWNALHWWTPAVIALVIALPIVMWANWSRRISVPIKLALTAIKAIALGLLVMCLLEPMYSFTRPEPGSNSLIVMADASQSLQVSDAGESESRATKLKRVLDDQSGWLKTLGDQFELHRYQFDSRAISVADFSNYSADGHGSKITGALQMVGKRTADKPLAGIVLLSDGNSSQVASSLADFDTQGLPPIYPVVIGGRRPARDLSITNVTTSQTNFESAPVTIKADLLAHGLAGETVKVELVGTSKKEGEKPVEKVIETQEVRQIENGRPFAVRFQLKPTDRGLNVFQIRAYTGSGSAGDVSASGVAISESESSTASTKTEDNTKSSPSPLNQSQQQEATLVNNQRTIVVDRGKGPFRILYVGGRPNWEYKFMRRALADDSETNLVGLLRVAKKEPKFTFRSRAGETTNPLYRGFGNQKDATAEQYDESVLIRLDTRDEVELRDGFPKDAATLFEYDAIVLDDLEASFFTQDQKMLISQFVSLRGGGLLMLGGLGSFASGGYDRTPIGETLPVYLDSQQPASPKTSFQLELTREGWVQPWVRIESTRSKEEQRLETMPEFESISIARSIKPGASVLANVKGDDDNVYPALVVQRFGKGRTAAMLVGDLWRWKMQTEVENKDLNKAWRQTMRWLVSEVPRRVEVDIKPTKNGSANQMILNVQTNDEEYNPQLNATVELSVTSPSGQEIKLTADQDTTKVGRYQTSFVSRETGAYRVTATVKSPEGNLIEQRESGWVSDPGVDEFRSLIPNRKFLEQLAEKTGGQVIELDDLDSFANDFENRKVPVTQTRTAPWWHRWWIFAAAITLLVVEWGSRRMLGLA